MLMFVCHSQAFARTRKPFARILKKISKKLYPFALFVMDLQKFARIRKNFTSIHKAPLFFSISPGQSYHFQWICCKFQIFIFIGIFATVWEQHQQNLCHTDDCKCSYNFTFPPPINCIYKEFQAEETDPNDNSDLFSCKNVDFRKDSKNSDTQENAVDLL